MSVRSRVPTLREERRLLRSGHLYVAGMDEVGRGALAGPVSVGVVVVDAASRSAPSGVRDSKLLTPAVREALVPKLRRWAVCSAVGHAEPEEIDSYGIIAALRLAGRRALAQLTAAPSCVLLDGSHDWLTTTAEPAGLFELDVPGRRPAPVIELPVDPVVTTLVKADLRCAAVAAASVLAKVERDAIMVRRAAEFPAYGWQENKGYSAPEHAAALRRAGPCVQHRRTWSLPMAEPLAAEGPAVEGLAAEEMAVEESAVAEELAAEEPAVAEELAAEEPAAELAVAEEPAAEDLLDLVRAEMVGAGADPGRHADAAAALRHDGSVAR